LRAAGRAAKSGGRRLLAGQTTAPKRRRQRIHASGRGRQLPGLPSAAYERGRVTPQPRVTSLMPCEANNCCAEREGSRFAESSRRGTARCGGRRPGSAGMRSLKSSCRAPSVRSPSAGHRPHSLSATTGAEARAVTKPRWTSPAFPCARKAQRDLGSCCWLRQVTTHALREGLMCHEASSATDRHARGGGAPPTQRDPLSVSHASCSR
jgi:hypothetical protein